ncbi:MAG: hypothetical protein ACFB9M_01465 [Myxococcota bacterium]
MNMHQEVTVNEPKTAAEVRTQLKAQLEAFGTKSRDYAQELWRDSQTLAETSWTLATTYVSELRPQNRKKNDSSTSAAA